MSRLRASAPVVVLLAGCGMLGAGVAGVARVDAPLQAAAEQQAPAVQREDVTWHHRDHRGDCPQPKARPTERT